LQYNFTVNGLNFTTFSDSYYNDVSHLNFWLRQCPSPYTLFNQVNYLCYTACPAGTYLIVADSLCLPCDYSCATCDTAGNCITCPTNRVLNGTSGLCVCIDYYYELNKVCIACHYSCLTCYSTQNTSCLSCSAVDFRLFYDSTSECLCQNGYF
jgi:proprotein convertase subtilisin/kexin type 5